MTHEGPQDVATSHGHSHEGYYQSGAYIISDLLMEIREFCVAHVHGHSHVGAFTDYPRTYEFIDFPIINPGSLALGEYATMKLSLYNDGEIEHPMWYVASETKKHIPTLGFHNIAGMEEYEEGENYEEEDHLSHHDFHDEDGEDNVDIDLDDFDEDDFEDEEHHAHFKASVQDKKTAKETKGKKVEHDMDSSKKHHDSTKPTKADAKNAHFKHGVDSNVMNSLLKPPSDEVEFWQGKTKSTKVRSHKYLS